MERRKTWFYYACGTWPEAGKLAENAISEIFWQLSAVCIQMFDALIERPI